jgi:hypothetical protein
MKYRVLHTRLTHTPFSADPKKPAGPDVTFKAGDIIAPSDLEGTDWTPEFLLNNGAIEAIDGTEEPGESRPVKTPAPASTATVQRQGPAVPAPAPAAPAPAAPKK